MPNVKNAKGEQVVLVHGFLSLGAAMKPMGRSLRNAGYEVYTVSYPTHSLTPREVVEYVSNQINALPIKDDEPVHFVAHSMGGIILRKYLEDTPHNNLGKVVMVGTPNRGIPLLSELDDYSFYHLLLGPTAINLGIDSEDFPNQLSSPYYPLGVIAGTKSRIPFSNSLLGETNDGVVPVSRVRFLGMTDYMEVPVTHQQQRKHPLVIKEVKYFLEKGYFTAGTKSGAQFQNQLK
ncbi:MAG: alpha/beta fold hydrolase [Lentisphaeria bacterium]|nr:alpha/beta fold hydrolase [Lentisphaeria bacterium]